MTRISLNGYFQPSINTFSGKYLNFLDQSLIFDRLSQKTCCTRLYIVPIRCFAALGVVLTASADMVNWYVRAVIIEPIHQLRNGFQLVSGRDKVANLVSSFVLLLFIILMPFGYLPSVGCRAFTGSDAENGLMHTFILQNLKRTMDEDDRNLEQGLEPSGVLGVLCFSGVYNCTRVEVLHRALSSGLDPNTCLQEGDWAGVDMGNPFVSMFDSFADDSTPALLMRNRLVSPFSEEAGRMIVFAGGKFTREEIVLGTPERIDDIVRIYNEATQEITSLRAWLPTVMEDEVVATPSSDYIDEETEQLIKGSHGQLARPLWTVVAEYWLPAIPKPLGVTHYHRLAIRNREASLRRDRDDQL
ncbi:MAG: hypothetical protein H0X51_09790 [Parachlamydiaceae bacterium]|nr:hypothetical protein [Parachlamydiaceae bacterium]